MSEIAFCLHHYIKRSTLHQKTPPPIHITNNDFLGATTVFAENAINVASRVLNINKHYAHSTRISSENVTDAIYHKAHSLTDHFY
jgi:hypothetical protein